MVSDQTDDPTWRLRASRSALTFFDHVTDVLELVTQIQSGAAAVVGLHAMMVNLDLDAEDPDVADQMGRRADHAKVLMASDFGTLHGNLLLGVWGAFEACIDDMCVAALSDAEMRRTSSVLDRLKVDLGGFLTLAEEERWPWVLDQLKRSESSSLKEGVAQFETLLKRCGLGGTVEGTLSTLLFKVKAARNVIAHRGARADARLCSAVAEWGLAVGDPVVLSERQLKAALIGMARYVHVVVRRYSTDSPEDLEPAVTYQDLLDRFLTRTTSAFPGTSLDDFFDIA